jgi:hypothetical protein
MCLLVLKLKCEFPEIYSLRGSPSKYLLTYSLMELSPSGGTANSAATQEFPAFYGTRRFITVFSIALH